MTVPVSWIICFVLGLLIGAAGAWRAGRRAERQSVHRRLAAAKDGEMWQALHYLTIDEEQDKRQVKRQKLVDLADATTQKVRRRE